MCVGPEVHQWVRKPQNQKPRSPNCQPAKKLKPNFRTAMRGMQALCKKGLEASKKKLSHNSSPHPKTAALGTGKSRRRDRHHREQATPTVNT